MVIPLGIRSLYCILKMSRYLVKGSILEDTDRCIKVATSIATTSNSAKKGLAALVFHNIFKQNTILPNYL